MSWASDGPLEPSWVNDREWEQEIYYECEAEDEEGTPQCDFAGEIMMSCVGQSSFTAYYECPKCGTDGYLEKYSDGGDW